VRCGGADVSGADDRYLRSAHYFLLKGWLPLHVIDDLFSELRAGHLLRALHLTKEEMIHLPGQTRARDQAARG
jgi:hypothetical protein